MGKTKWYAESENNTSQPGFRVGHQSQHRRQKSAPGRIIFETPETIPLRVLFRQILLRFRRNWIAFRFRVDRYTMGIFRHHTLLKLGTLTVVGYVLFFSDRQFLFFAQDMLNRGPEEGMAVETSLESDAETAVTKKRAITRKKPKNDAAPLAIYDLKEDQSEDYIARYSKIAVTEMKKYGIPASISLAQGLVESRYGTSTLARQNNNHFGMKCFSTKCKKGHCTNFSDDNHKDFFRKFTNAWESWRAHSQMLAAGRYTRLKKYGYDYRRWAQGLEQLGYATDRSYAEKLVGVIERYNLHRFDH